MGGASISYQAFPEFPVQLSRYSYLVSLFPDQIKRDLGLTFRTLSRSVSSYTPVHQGEEHLGLLVERTPSQITKDSFRKLTGTDKEFESWQNFYSRLETLAKYLAPSLLEPLQTQEGAKAGFSDQKLWQEIFELPIGRTITQHFMDDVVRGVVLTDAKGGTQNATLNMTFYAADYPNQTPVSYGPYTLTSSTQYITPRIRGRLISIYVASNDLGSFWRIGNVRYRVKTDGKF